MTTYSFTVLGPPQPKQRARAGKGGRHYTPAETVRYERAVKAVASLTKPPSWRTDGEYSLTIVAYFADRRPRDVDNVVKAVSDALNKVAFDDDNQVVKVSAEKHMADPVPRTEVTVQWLGERAVKARKKKAVA
jgi:Holliday junction resolvase RusA-like endonuclease